VDDEADRSKLAFHLMNRVGNRRVISQINYNRHGRDLRGIQFSRNTLEPGWVASGKGDSEPVASQRHGYGRAQRSTRSDNQGDGPAVAWSRMSALTGRSRSGMRDANHAFAFQ
jgi:hypothetical protein